MSPSYPPGIQAVVDEELARVAGADVQLPFSQGEYARRLQRLRAGMMAADIDVLVLMAPDAMGWLHGFGCRVYDWHSSTAFAPTTATVVHATDDPMFFIDTPLHTELVRLTSCIEDFRPIPEAGMASFAGAEQFLHFLIGELRREGWTTGTVGLERSSGIPNPAVAGIMEDALRGAGYRVVDATAPIRAARRLKSTEEIAMIERAQAACDAGLRALQRDARRDMTELEAWHVYMGGVIAAGGEPSAIHETVAAGPMDAFGHALSSSHRRLGDGAHFTPDASAAVERYHARGTRPYSFGAPRRELARVAEILRGAGDVVLETAKVGMPFRDLNRAVQRYFRSESIGDDVAFGGGYELGLSFAPDFVGEFLWGSHDIETDAVIEDGLVTNFESVGFLAIIDTLHFREEGARFLSSVPRDLLVVDA